MHFDYSQPLKVSDLDWPLKATKKAFAEAKTLKCVKSSSAINRNYLQNGNKCSAKKSVSLVKFFCDSWLLN